MQYPLIYSKGCPLVYFTPKKYKFPLGNSEKSKVETIPGYEGVEGVALYIPGSFKESSGSSWEMQNIIGGPAEGLSSGAANELATLAKTAMGSKISSTASAYTGSIAMPLDLLVYGGPNPIDLTFSFKMIAISSAENIAIDKIVRNFKKASSPKQITAGMLTYPPIWDIDFSGAKSLGYGDKSGYSWMALTGCNVSYSGESNIQVYADELATEVNLDLTFKCVKKFMDK